ncbi:ankyrin repeat-containing protein At5g02620-like [Corylus avellana]|uniref:ankyrin repeat-containing protein At5g02620-like n=1 Tax=Corylus avellana TaxID=13451 RepID=UPI00286D1D44|nr:ankyrin repeat-containing protein At5g02620-like [Corylus avellana]
MVSELKVLRLNPYGSMVLEYDIRAKGERTLDEYRAQCGPLLQAALKGDWSAANAFLRQYPGCVRVPITKQRDTALHSAVAVKGTSFVEELLKQMNPDDLQLRNINGATALHVAAQTGDVRIAKKMVEKNKQLPLMNNSQGMKPLHVAAHLGHKHMVNYLFSFSVTSFEDLTTVDRINLLHYTITAGFYGIALQILIKDPNLANADAGTEFRRRALAELARKPFVIGRQRHKGMYTNDLMGTLAHQIVERLWNMVNEVPRERFSSKLVHDYMTLLVEAAKVGNVEFIMIIVRSYPDLLWQVDEEYGSLFHVATLYRQESVFNLIDNIGSMKENFTTYITFKGDNMLHFAGKLGANSDRLNTTSTSALQMQQELLWFKKIAKIVPPSYVYMKNSEHETPNDIFIREHKVLYEKGEKWMKQTANYCMVVATLIATVVFTAAFTVPGGNHQITGKPLLLNSISFKVFFISNGIALVFSSTSILIFLSILTSRYGEKDFFKSIPLRLLFGLAALFIAIAGMVIAFSATFFLVYYSEAKWAPILITSLASIPIILFVLAHFRLYVDTIHSTYWSRFLFRSHKRKIF